MKNLCERDWYKVMVLLYYCGYVTTMSFQCHNCVMYTRAQYTVCDMAYIGTMNIISGCFSNREYLVRVRACLVELVLKLVSGKVWPGKCLLYWHACFSLKNEIQQHWHRLLSNNSELPSPVQSPLKAIAFKLTTHLPTIYQLVQHLLFRETYQVKSRTALTAAELTAKSLK